MHGDGRSAAPSQESRGEGRRQQGDEVGGGDGGRARGDPGGGREGGAVGEDSSTVVDQGEVWVGEREGSGWKKLRGEKRKRRKGEKKEKKRRENEEGEKIKRREVGGPVRETQKTEEGGCKVQGGRKGKLPGAGLGFGG